MLCKHRAMLVIDAAVWPGGESSGTEGLGRIAIGRVATSAGGDYANYLVVHLDAQGDVTKASLLRRRHVMAGWQDLLWAALDGEGAEPVPLDDPRVTNVADKLRAGLASADASDHR